ncbi:hypothetical protein E2C01_059048 [Portunus trituberculatus]|uniref:Uncharacterized protein n=1 Tax=Portunus trituberculatus TaxID=210409 RepID=A0A5B7H4S6_PORTR|nr:hypothetical protein [Portunus trituberculatus]
MYGAGAEKKRGKRIGRLVIFTGHQGPGDEGKEQSRTTGETSYTPTHLPPSLPHRATTTLTTVTTRAARLAACCGMLTVAHNIPASLRLARNSVAIVSQHRCAQLPSRCNENVLLG